MAFNGALGDQLNDGRHYTTIDIGGGSTELALGNRTAFTGADLIL